VGRPEAIYDGIRRQRDPTRIGNCETNRPRVNHDLVLDDHEAFDAMRLRVIEPNDIANLEVASNDLVHRHVASV
jgi:hypothetical protein